MLKLLGRIVLAKTGILLYYFSYKIYRI